MINCFLPSSPVPNIQSPLAFGPHFGSFGSIGLSKSRILAKPFTSPSPKRSPPFTISSKSCLGEIDTHLSSPLLPTLLSGVKTLALS